MSDRIESWPTLDYPADRHTLEALHMQSQVVGKVKLALTPPAPEWQQVPLWMNARGFTTGLLPAGDTGLEIAFDLLEHRLTFRTSDGRAEGFDLRPRPLREFTAEVMGTLRGLGVEVTINPVTVEVPNPVRCDVHEGFDAYDPDVARRLFHVLSQVALIFERFRTGFWGKQSPVSFFWGSFDLATVRYNLVPVPATEGIGPIYRVAMDSEQIAVGFWAGSERYERAAFFGYPFPRPAGAETAAVAPAGARWEPALGEFILDYDDARMVEDPGAAILAFANSVYDVGATMLGWDRALLERRPGA